jgi:hypothetical protein
MLVGWRPLSRHGRSRHDARLMLMMLQYGLLFTFLQNRPSLNK